MLPGDYYLHFGADVHPTDRLRWASRIMSACVDYYGRHAREIRLHFNENFEPHQIVFFDHANFHVQRIHPATGLVERATHRIEWGSVYKLSLDVDGAEIALAE